MCSTVLAGAVCEANIDLYCGTVPFVVDIDWSGTAVALVWYCPVCSQYRLVCPENVADLLHLGFIFNFPSDWVENGGNGRGGTLPGKSDEDEKDFLPFGHFHKFTDGPKNSFFIQIYACCFSPSFVNFVWHTAVEFGQR